MLLLLTATQSKASKKLKWKSETSFGALIKLMCDAERNKNMFSEFV